MADSSRKPHRNNNLDFAPESARAEGETRAPQKSPGLLSRLLGWKRSEEVSRRVTPLDPLAPKERPFRGSEQSFEAIRTHRFQDTKRQS